MKQLLNPEAVGKSVCEAIMLTYECSASISRVRGFISNLPAGSLHYKSDKLKSGKAFFRFFQYIGGQETYLRKDSTQLYGLCRKRYLVLLLRALELRNELFSPCNTSKRSVHAINREIECTVDSLMKLLGVYAAGNLDIARIVLTSRQYKWFAGSYSKKAFRSDTSFLTNSEIAVRSKSERDIGNNYEEYAVPYHYEEVMVLNVAAIVKKFEQSVLAQGGYNPVYYMKGNSCYWNVPPAFQYMNMIGSIWRAYQPNTGKIYIYNDFHVMLADGNIVVHEHEGAVEDFDYRSNAAERIYVMRLTGAVNDQNLITTLESDVRGFSDVIRNRILPGLWF